jgi:hypothetical protein
VGLQKHLVRGPAGPTVGEQLCGQVGVAVRERAVVVDQLYPLDQGGLYLDSWGRYLASISA